MMQLCYLIIRIMCCVVQSCICLGITDSHIIISRDFPFLTLAVLVAILHAGMKFCESYVAIFYNPSIVLRLEDGLAACFICYWKAFLLGGNNFSSVDLIILFRNVLSLSVSISQPSLVEIWVHKKLLWLVTHIYRDFNGSTIISKVHQCSYIIQPTLTCQ